MNKEEKKVLIVEDERSIADVLEEGLRGSSQYRYQVEKVIDTSEFISKGVFDKSFDIYIVDLLLTRGVGTFFGLKVVSFCAYHNPNALIIVYTGYGDEKSVGPPTTSNTVRALQLGATDVVSKTECLPHELVKRIEDILNNQQQQIERRLKIDQDCNEGKYDEYAGKTIAIVNDQVIAQGDNRLETLIHYDQLLQVHPDWPDEPDIIDIHGKGM